MDLKNEDMERIERLEGEGGFSIPDGYISRLEEDLLNKTTRNGFRVPEKYFEAMESQILRKVQKEKILRLVTVKKVVIGMAASLLLVSGLFILKVMNDRNNLSTQYSESKLNSVSDEEIINYVEAADISDAHLDEVALRNEDKTQKQVEDYLINNTDEQLIIDEL